MAGVVAVLCGAPGGATAQEPQPPRVGFAEEVAPLLARHCLECHNAGDHKGGLDLSSAETFRKGGESGPVVSRDKPADSLLLARVLGDEMPPDHPLSDAAKEMLRRWIEAGAAWDSARIDPFAYSSDRRGGYDWWSLQPVRRTRPPETDRADWSNNPIDRFIVAKLEAAGLEPSAPADRPTLIRRLSFDLSGLPPSPEDVARFVGDARPDAYERLVDRLLASPQYGEHWARHWLDIIRFGESQGFERDKFRPHQWRYRNWVVNAWNEDLPYDEFARLQLAGDALRPSASEGIIATGFLVAGAYDEVGQNQQSEVMKAVVRQDEMEDLVSAVGQTFLALTLHCARCHDHKFDPVTQQEYYQICAALAGVRHGERQIASAAIGRSIKRLESELLSRANDIEARLFALGEDALATQPAGSGEVDATSSVSQEAGRSGEQPSEPLSPAKAELREQLLFEQEHIKQQLERVREPVAYAVDPKQPGPVHLLARGNPTAALGVVSAMGIRAVGGIDPDFGLPHDAPEAERRVQLAEWITSPDNPLFARVIANRLWHYHFGTGIVETPSDLGFNGGRPSHPELLDWLASEVQLHGFRLKYLQRLIVTSAAYRQSGALRAEPFARDADNRLLWRNSPQRLGAEPLRDSMLAVAGRLNTALGGPGFIDFTTYTRNAQFYDVIDPVGWSFCRRSLYRAWIRSGRSRFLDVFDCPDPSTKTPVRAVTTTPLQSLSLLNHSFTLRMADRMAERLATEFPESTTAQVERAHRLLYGRGADPTDIDLGESFIHEHGLAAYCRVLFNTNEFLYVE